MLYDYDIIGNYCLTPSSNWFGCNNNNFSENSVTTTNTSKFALKIEEVVQKGHYVSGHVIMNQHGSLLTRENIS